MLGAHVNAALNGLDGALQGWKPSLVVVLDHSDVWRHVKAQSPLTVFVGRIPQSSEPDFNDPKLDPVRVARAHCEMILPMAERMGQTYDFWQGVNEPVIQSADAMRRLADFEGERLHILSSQGYRAVVGSFSVGNPAQLAHWRYFLPALEAAQQLKGVLGLHEYAWPSLDCEWPWYLLRHRKVYNGEPAYGWEGLPAHLKRLPLLITECGLDGLIEKPNPPRGWQVLYGRDLGRYLEQLAWYDVELQKDPYVVGAALYCCCTANDPRWASYNIWPVIVQPLAQQASPLYRLAQLMAPEEPKPAPRPAPVEPAKPVQPPVEAPPPSEPPQQPPASGPQPEPRPIPPAEPQPAPPPRGQGPGGGGGRYILASLPTGQVQPPNAPPPPAPPPSPAAEELLAQVLGRLDRIMDLLRDDRASGDAVQRQ